MTFMIEVTSSFAVLAVIIYRTWIPESGFLDISYCQFKLHAKKYSVPRTTSQN